MIKYRIKDVEGFDSAHPEHCNIIAFYREQGEELILRHTGCGEFDIEGSGYWVSHKDVAKYFTPVEAPELLTTVWTVTEVMFDAKGQLLVRTLGVFEDEKIAMEVAADSIHPTHVSDAEIIYGKAGK